MCRAPSRFFEMAPSSLVFVFISRSACSVTAFKIRALHRIVHRIGVATAALGAAVRRQLAESFCFQVADFLQFGGRLNQPVICLFRRCRFYLARSLCSLLCVYVLLRFIAIHSELRSNAAWLRLFVLSAYYLPVVHLLIC